ncbi:MAG TPA: muconolactone Delta-isomerase family protein [bacterium]|nr:muconolactone Delta-isomerase family protein [bacterium]HPN43742.1 muconolactone Delta-isomerase family protein [bacterium]
MRILALEQTVPGIMGEQFTPFLKDEAKRVWELNQQGIIRDIWFRADRRDAIVMLECHDVKEAQEYLATLPLVENGLIRFEVIPLAPYTGYARLFNDPAIKP